MRPAVVSLYRLLLFAAVALSVPAVVRAQAAAPASRVVDRVDDAVLVPLRGNTHPLAQAQYDQGAAPPTLAMGRMLLVLKRSDAQEAALEQLLDDQQDLNSPNYHQWLTPDQFGQQFGPSDQDVQAAALWLGLHGFQVSRISRGRTAIEFSGTAQQVQQAFHTEVHSYVVNGEQHWANASDPQIPAALAPVIAGINSLHNFAKKPLYRLAAKAPSGGAAAGASRPETTLLNGNDCPPNGCYFVSPYDFATIYNVLPLWNASPAVNGAGQSIAIINRSNINIQDARDFRNLFGLPANDPQVTVDGTDPGLTSDAETEADLDVEWSGAVATGATIKLVIAQSTSATDGVDLAALYAVENSVAPVISESFGQCELFIGNAGNAFQSAIRQQAAGEGITFINSTGDQGAAVCDDVDTGSAPLPAIYGLSVSGLASTPYGVAVGGTDFLNFGANFNFSSPSPYWNATNDPQHQASAIGYVPETTWDDSCTNFGWAFVKGAGATPEAVCNNSQLQGDVVVAGGSGGKSSCINSSGPAPANCTGGYAKPSWQSAPGVPSDGARDVPDVSLFASNLFMASSYIICEADMDSGPCSLNAPLSSFVGIGGTSASAPAFAGIMALVNQSTNASQGNANYVLYKMAGSAAQTSHSCGATGSPSSSCIFYDVTSGTISMPCAKGTPNCNTTNTSDAYGILSGYSAAAGYDLATGLGSVNASNLVHNWIQPANSSTTSLTLNSGNAVNVTHGQSVNFSINVTPSAAAGVVALMGAPNGGSYEPLASFTLQNGSASGTTAALAGGTAYSVKAHYPGNGTYGPSDSAPVTVTVAPEASNTLVTLPTFSLNSGLETGNQPISILYGTPLGVRVDVGNAQAKVTYPAQPVCAALVCPTGTVLVADSVSGAPAVPIGPPGGAFGLNVQGYSETDGILFSGGTHQIAASYPGDNSYQKSTGTYNLLVNPALTQLQAPYSAFSISNFIVGMPEEIIANLNGEVSSGAAPTGTITFYDGAAPLPGTVSYFAQAGAVGTPSSLQATITTTFAASGTHQISAKYSGDANYAAAPSSPTSFSVLYATTGAETASAQTVNLGQSVTLTATVTSSSQNPPMTGTFQFYGNTSIASSVTGTLSTDANGNQILTATVTTTPQYTEGIQMTYSGDSNFQGASAFVFVNVILPNFNISSNSSGMTIVAGQSGSAQVTLTPVNNLSSTVALSCSVNAVVGASCAFNPTSLNLSNGAPASATVTVSTLPPSSGASTSKLGIRPVRMRIPPSAGLWSACFVAGIALWLIALFREDKKRLARRIGSMALVCAMLGCGSASSGTTGGTGGTGGNGGGNANPVPTTLTLTTSAIKVALGTNVSLTAAITPSGGASAKPITGTVTFFDSGTPIQYVTVVAGSAAFNAAGYLYIGTHVITAQYNGDANNQASSTKGALNQVITGTTQILVSGASPGISNSTTVNVTIQ